MKCTSLVLLVVFFAVVLSLAFIARRRAVSLRFSNNHARIIHLTYKTRGAVPNHIWAQYEKYAPDFQVSFADDAECEMAVARFSDAALSRYKSLKNSAHRADLYRYCVLYESGGLYFDIKTLLTRPVREMFSNDEDSFVTLSLIGHAEPGPKCVYQGILKFPPKSPIMLSAINDAIAKPPANYLDYTRRMYEIVRRHVDRRELATGIYKVDNSLGSLHVFKEYATDDCTKRDRHRRCRIDVLNHDGDVMCTVRDPSYPWV